MPQTFLRPLACLLIAAITIVAARASTITVRDANVTVKDPGAHALAFEINRDRRGGDAIRVVLETAVGGPNPAVPGEDYAPLPRGTDLLIEPDGDSATATVTVFGMAQRDEERTLLLRILEARAVSSEARLRPAASRFPIGGSLPRSMALADLNGDQRLDIATGNDLSLDVSVLLNRGDGNFAEPLLLPVTMAPLVFHIDVAVGDATGDGHPDIIAGGSSNEALFLFAGDGRGSFGRPLPIALNITDVPSTLALADVNNDRTLDIVFAAGFGGKAVYVMLGSGNGVFAPPAESPNTPGATSMTFGDVNGDKAIDIVTANDHFPVGTVSVLLGDGAGAFGPPQILSTGPNAIPRFVILADVTGRRGLDIVTSNNVFNPGREVGGSVSVLEGDGVGGFGAAQQFALGPEDGPGAAVAAADVFGDSHVDLVITLPLSSSVAVLAGNGNGGFAAPAKFATANGPTVVEIGDVTGDRKLDVVAASVAGISVLASDGKGSIGLGGRFRVGKYPHSIVALDLDGNGYPDVATANAQSNDVSVLLNQGAGQFAAEVRYTVGSFPLWITAGDLNGDSIPDLVTGTFKTVSILLGEGAGRFRQVVQYPIGDETQTVYAVTLGDVDHDGDLDIATANVNTQYEGISVLLGNGTGGFGAPTVYPVGEGIQYRSPHAIALADVTADGNVDIVTANSTSSDLSLLAGDGRGNFAPAVHLQTSQGPVEVKAADVNADGHRDLVVLNHTAQSVSVFRADGRGGFGGNNEFPISRTAPGFCGSFDCPWPWGLALADITGDGRLDIITANTDSDAVSVLPNDGAGNFPTFSLFDAGAHPGSLAAADVNGDGNLDVITANRENNDIAVLVNLLEHVEVRDAEAVGTIRWKWEDDD